MNQLNTPETGNNELKFEYQCPLLWQNLAKTEDEKTRFCHTCEKKVTFIESQDELHQAAYSGSCGFFMRNGNTFFTIKEMDNWNPGMPSPPYGFVIGGHFAPPPGFSPPRKNPLLRIKDKIFGLFFRR